MFSVEALVQEFNFKAIRSSGSGGQHVNKVSSKVELSFSVIESTILNEFQKEIIIKKLAHRLTKDSVLVLQCDEKRSQHNNKAIVIKRGIAILKAALIIRKKRIPTKIPKSVIKKRLKNKRIQSERKTNRKKPDLD
ncbi:alternative ribosome rescue aminoacyl-tRNA hydrolase ArfB [Pontimicrobium sp. MEBiC06410]